MANRLLGYLSFASRNQILKMIVRFTYVVAIKPLGKLLQLSVIEYPERVREVSDYESEVENVLISDEERI